MGGPVGGDSSGTSPGRGPGVGRGRNAVAIARLSSEFREYDDWLDGVEPAWTALEPARLEALMREPSGEDGALRLGENLTDEELDRSAMVRNALVLLRAAADGDGVELTARGNLTRATVSAMRAAMDWPGCAFEEKRRAGKLLSEDHVDELRPAAGARRGSRTCGACRRQAANHGAGPGSAHRASGQAPGGAVPDRALAREPQPVRSRGVRLLAAAAGRRGALGAVDDGGPASGHLSPHEARRAARRGGQEL